MYPVFAQHIMFMSRIDHVIDLYIFVDGCFYKTYRMLLNHYRVLQSMNKKLAKENELLKKLLAEKELEAKLKDEILKKKLAQWNRGKK